MKLGGALVGLRMVPKDIPKTLPVLDCNASVTIPSSSTRGKCPLCSHAEHSGGCTEAIKYDPKGKGEGRRVEAKADSKAEGTCSKGWSPYQHLHR